MPGMQIAHGGDHRGVLEGLELRAQLGERVNDLHR
jgi:hypothetical protein